MLTALIALAAYRTITWTNRRQAAARHRQVHTQAQCLVDTIAASMPPWMAMNGAPQSMGWADHVRLLDGLATLGKALKRAGITRPAKPKSPQPVPPMIAIWEGRGKNGTQ